MDIRKFLVSKSAPKKRVIEDDDDDVIPESPEVLNNKKKKTKTESTTNKTKSSKPALKEVKPLDLFGKGPIKRTEPIVKKETKNTETGIHSDDEFDKSLLELDNFDDNITKDDKNIKTEAKTPNKNDKSKKDTPEFKKELKDKKKSEKQSLSLKKDDKNKHNDKKQESSKKTVENIKKEIRDNNKRKFEEFIEVPVNNESKKKKIEKSESKKDEKSDFKRDEKCNIKKHEDIDIKNVDVKNELHDNTVDDSILDDEDSHTKNKKKRVNKSLNESVLSDEERHERKLHSAALYQKYLNRSGPKHLGTKEMPEGADNCLKDCAFLLTGVLDSFERDEVVDTIKKYGGTIKSGISKKVTHVLAGDEAGPAKMAKAQELGIKIINEDEFLEMIKDSKKVNTKKLDKHSSDKKGSEKLKDKNSERISNHSKESKHTKTEKHDKSREKEIKNREKSKSPSKEKTKNKLEIKKRETSKSPAKDKLETKRRQKSKSPNKVEVVKLNDKMKSENESTSSYQSIDVKLSDKDVCGTMWVEKYKPQNLKQIIGQHGEASNVNKLINWLTKWYVNRKAKLPKPSPWAKNDDGGYYKAALLSGPPGVGKTTTVSLVCKELGFDMVEFNASDTRNKTLIKEQIGELLTTTSLSAYARGDTGKQAVTKKHVLVMDEVDGMAGNEDRGGLQELIGLIKSTSVPIICMCNDRNSQKMRSLVNYCYDLRFNRPKVEQIKAAMRSICCKENIKVPPDVLAQLIVSANQDVRQTLNLLSMWAVDPTRMDADKLTKDASIAKKDVKLGPWEAIRKVFSAEEHKTMSLNDKSDLFFYDYSLAPLFVQENYLQVQPHCPKHEVLERISKAADSIAYGDVIEAKIRGSQMWSLLPVQAMFSSVLPGHYMSGHITGQIQFPGWLGKNSRATKMHRLCQEIHAHTRLSTTGSKSSIYLDYAPHLRDAIYNPLIKDKSDGIDKSLEVLESYHLLREDLDSLTELSLWPGQRNPTVLVDSKVKAAMTRLYNKKATALPYAPGAIKKGRAKDENDLIDDEEQADEDDDQPDDSDPENDALIKKKKTKEPAKSSGNDKPSTSKGKSSNSKGKKK